MQKILIDKKSIMAAIQQGDNYSGGWYLIVDENGKSEVKWAESNRQWNPWQESDQVFAIPALDPDGSGRESTDAFDCLLAIDPRWRADEIARFKAENADIISDYEPDDWQAMIEAVKEEKDISWVEMLEKYFPEDWEVDRQEALDWYADQFIEALNGNEDVHSVAGCVGFYDNQERLFEFDYE